MVIVSLMSKGHGPPAGDCPRFPPVSTRFPPTTTETGLKIRCRLDTRSYPKGIKISDEQMEQIN
ncbi:MAG: hypothetical protein IID54_03930, partial [Proteobacteria bacterium]|nr:hypothetical protein [Pseudomonadota bacterium]